MATVKNSKQRDAVIKILQSTNTHPTAEWVYEELRKEFPNASLATVYRNLKFMIECGLARELYTDNSSRFDANMTNHYHFLCKCCNNLIDIFPDDNNAVEANFEKMGFKVEKCDISLYGICSECGDK
ncbi:MAG: Fur family transcriptional regulator [Clostridia bacterium]